MALLVQCGSEEEGGFEKVTVSVALATQVTVSAASHVTDACVDTVHDADMQLLPVRAKWTCSAHKGNTRE